MAKMKAYAVTVEYTVRRTLIVDARKPGGAAQRALTDEGWWEATKYSDDDGVPVAVPPGTRVVRVDEV